MAAYNGGETAVAPPTEVGPLADYRGPNQAHTLNVAPDFSAAYRRGTMPVDDDADDC